MSENKQRPGNTRRPEREWDETTNRNSDQGYRGQGANDYDGSQHNAQGQSPQWNRTNGFQGDEFGGGYQGGSNYNRGGNWNADANYGQGNYAGRNYGAGFQGREWDDQDANSNYGSRGFNNSGRGYQGREDDPQFDNYRGRENSSRNMYGNDYGQGQYGSQMGRSYNNYNQGSQQSRGGYEPNRPGSFGNDYSNSYGRGTNYGMGANYGSNTNYGSGNWGSGANYGSGTGNTGSGNWGAGSGNYGSGTGYMGTGNDTAWGSRQGGQQTLHKGKGPKGYNRSDDRIKEDISDRLSDDGQIDASDIEVDVKNGVVSLSGTVDSRDVKRRAEDLAESISGVTNVENSIRVKYQRQESDSSSSRQGSQSSKSSTSTGSSSSSSSLDGSLNNSDKNKRANSVA